VAFSAEERAVKNFLKMVGDIDFRPEIFAVHVSIATTALQHRVLDLLMAVVDHYSNMLDEDLYSPETYDLCIRAKRMQDAMVHFR